LIAVVVTGVGGKGDCCCRLVGGAKIPFHTGMLLILSPAIMPWTLLGSWVLQPGVKVSLNAVPGPENLSLERSSCIQNVEFYFFFQFFQHFVKKITKRQHEIMFNTIS